MGMVQSGLVWEEFLRGYEVDVLQKGIGWQHFDCIKDFAQK